MRTIYHYLALFSTFRPLFPPSCPVSRTILQLLHLQRSVRGEAEEREDLPGGRLQEHHVRVSFWLPRHSMVANVTHSPTHWGIMKDRHIKDFDAAVSFFLSFFSFPSFTSHRPSMWYVRDSSSPPPLPLSSLDRFLTLSSPLLLPCFLSSLLQHSLMHALSLVLPLARRAAPPSYFLQLQLSPPLSTLSPQLLL